MTLFFENDKVRILWGMLRANESEPLHIHALPSLLIMITGTIFETIDATGEKKLDDSPMGVYKLEPDPKAVSYKNIGDNPASWLRFELKQGYS